MPAQIFIRPLVLLSTLLAAMTAVRGAPYNGWGPSESYGHTGTKVASLNLSKEGWKLLKKFRNIDLNYVQFN